MSLYAQYVHERTSKNILETDHGFAVYSFTPDSVYIEDIYVSPDYRHSGEASRMADDIAEQAKTKGLKKMLGSICPSAKHSTEGLKVLLAYGFKLDSSANNFVVLVKEL